MSLGSTSNFSARRVDAAAEAVCGLVLVSDHVISWQDPWRALIHSQVTRHVRNIAVWETNQRDNYWGLSECAGCVQNASANSTSVVNAS